MTNSLDEYAKIFTELGLSELSVEDEGFKLTLKKNLQVVFNEKQEAPRQEPVLIKQEEEPVAVSDNLEVKSPLLGIFFAEVNGKALSVGDTVKEGDVLCSIEAMKMMNEVKAPSGGKIVRIGASEGDLVEYDQVLFEIA